MEELTMILLFTVVIPTCVVFGTIFGKRWIKFQEKKLELYSQDAIERAAQYAAQTERLEQRMRVLERIITDKGGDLASEIEDLRDKPLN